MRCEEECEVWFSCPWFMDVPTTPLFRCSPEAMPCRFCGPVKLVGFAIFCEICCCENC